MSAIGRSIDNLGFLTEAAREALRRRLRELAGLALIMLALLLADALGIAGATIADVLMQLLGIAALALVLPIAIWGWRLTTHRPLHRERIRLVVWIAAVLLFSGFAACLPRTATWPLPAGLGGVVGDGMLRLALLVVGESLFGLTRVVVGLVTGFG